MSGKMNFGSIALSGSGFMADAYDLFIINIVNVVLKEEYPDAYSPDNVSMVTSVALWGAVGGQLLFGSLADIIGRRIIFIITLCLIVLGSLLSSTCINSSSFTVYQQLAIYRFFLGFGVGGEVCMQLLVYYLNYIF